MVRLSAIPVVQTPSVSPPNCLHFGGYADVRSAFRSAGVDVFATRTKAGVLGFGTDADMRSAFDAYGITDFDLHTIEIEAATI